MEKYDFLLLIYNNKKNMKKNYSNEKRKKITVTIDNDLIKLLDVHTSNRSHTINLSLKEYLTKNGYDTTKIKI